MSQPIEQFGKYTLLEKLASGGMAEVFLAKTKGANGVSKFLAIKRILPQFSDNSDFIEMFKEEAKIAVNLSHSNVVPIYDFGIENQQFYLVMEYVEGRNLRQILNEFKKRSLIFSTEQVVYIVKEVASGLDYAHRCLDGATGRPLRITHRDMSPQNIMLSFEAEVKVIDFGIAKAETQMEATKAGTLKGKFGYMSPEQSEGIPIDPRTDVFSLGIVLWELLASERLFSGNSEAAILKKIRDCEIPSVRKINPSIPLELEKIVFKALAKDKSLRYQTAEQMQKDLNRFLNTEYPDFSSHDFSIFIKNTFAEIYSDNKKKLVEYARLQTAVSEVSAETRTMTFVSIDEESVPELPMEQPVLVPQGPIGLQETNDVEMALSVPDKKSLPVKSTLAIPQGSLNKKENPGQKRSWLGAKSQVLNAVKEQARRERNSAVMAGRRRKKTSIWEGIGRFLRSIIFAGMALGVLYVLLLIVFQAKVQERAYEKAHENSQTPNSPTPNSSTPGLFAVFIESEPPGAKITLNGKPTKDSTPAQFFLEPRQKVTLLLEKEDFFPSESEFIPDKDGASVKVLLSQGRSGFLTLSVVNGGLDPILEIDGKKISARPPLKQYRIPASVPVRIRVSNPYSQMTAEESITVQENEQANLQLVLTSKPIPNDSAKSE